MRAITILCMLVCCSWIASAQLKKQRLIARSLYYDTTKNSCCPLQLGDSIAFKYSGSRGSSFDYNLYDYIDPRVFQDEILVTRQLSIVNPNNVDSSYSSLRVMFDTMRYYRNSKLDGLVLEDVESCQYYPDGSPYRAARLDSNANPGDPWSYIEYVYFYGALIRVGFYDENTAAQRVLGAERFLIRDAFGNVVIDSSASYHPNYGRHGVIRYEYDALGRYIGKSGGFLRGQLFMYSRLLNRYDYYPDGKLRTMLIEEEDSSGRFVAFDSGAYEYMPGVPGYSKFTEYSLVPGNTPYQSYQSTRHINASGLKDTMIQDFGWNRTPVYNVAEYNAFGNPTSVTRYHINQDSTIWTHEKLYFYYELYDAPTGIPAGNNQGYPLSVFPNPATSELTIAFGAQAPHGPLSLSIANTIGQIVQTQTIEHPTPKVVIRLNNAIAPGLYALSIVGPGNETQYKGTFVKQ
jgi:hypothetical protein